MNKPGHHPAGAAVAGAAATVFHDAIMTPMDVVKQRLQLGYHKGMLDCVLTIRRTEGAQVGGVLRLVCMACLFFVFRVLCFRVLNVCFLVWVCWLACLGVFCCVCFAACVLHAFVCFFACALLACACLLAFAPVCVSRVFCLLGC